MLGIDSELQKMCKVLTEIDMRGVVSLKTHYESPTVSDLTRKIRSIPSFKGIYAPLIPTQSNEFRIDVNSRFFTEDFPYGLCIIKGFCEICGISTPYIDKVLQWYPGIYGCGILYKRWVYRNGSYKHSSSTKLWHRFP